MINKKTYNNETEEKQRISDEKYEMSVFRPPISNKYPLMTVSLFQVYQAVHTRRFAPETEALRAIQDEDAQRQYKQNHLHYVTPGGVFAYCNDKSLVKPSNILCMDLDHLDNVDGMKQRLLDDPHFDTLLLFRSPRGQGLKWFLEVDLQRCDYKTWFTAVRNYLMATYGVNEKQVDPVVGHISAGCFLCYDPDAYLKTELIKIF